MREWLARLWDWLRRRRLDRELTEELAFHRSRLERDAAAGGAPDPSAAREAARRLGNLTQAREEARDRWSWPWLEHLLRDCRFAARGLRRSPGFAATVIVTLGLGIGANAAMFGVVDRLMFRPYRYLRDPSAVHRVYLQFDDRNRTVTEGDGLEYARYLDLVRWTTTFSRLSGFAERTLAVGVGDDARERRVAAVSASFFDFFDAPPALGRYFGAAEDVTPRGAAVIVLGYEFWQRQYGGANVIGRTLRVQNLSCVIVGVASRGFVGVASGEAPALYLPITTVAAASPNQRAQITYYTKYNWGWMSVMARRKPGVTPAQASADLSQAYARSWAAERDLSSKLAPVAVAKPRAIAGPMKLAAGPDAGLESKTLLWVTGVAAIVLLIACANVTNLMLARVVERRRETAVRLALGVSRGRLLSQGLIESGLLALVGSIVGVAIAQWGAAALRGLFVPDGSLDVVTDRRTLVVAAGIAFLASIVTGLGPALVAGREDLTLRLKSGGQDGADSRPRLRAALLVVQAALSVTLLVGAALFTQSLGHVRRLRLGYDSEQVLLVEPNLRGVTLGDSEQVALGRRLVAAARGLPGVEHAAWVSSVPFWSTSVTSFFVTGIDSTRKLGRFTYQSASADYFPTMGTRVVRGRPFTGLDHAGTPRVVVVSEAMAGVLWPGRDPIGQCIRLQADTMPCTTVIGVAENAVQNSLTDDQRFHYYLPLDQFEPKEGFALLARFRTDAAASAESMRRALQRLMPGEGYITTKPLAEVVDQQRRSWQVGATMFLAFGALALVVAAVGLYGVIGYHVAQRMHELGIRTALGAGALDLVRLVVGQGLAVAILGVAAGSLAALAAARWIQPLLFAQSATDPATYGMVAGLLVAVALLACAVPAVRATRADPNTALRSD
jgi:predicted permease